MCSSALRATLTLVRLCACAAGERPGAPCYLGFLEANSSASGHATASSGHRVGLHAHSRIAAHLHVGLGSAAQGLGRVCFAAAHVGSTQSGGKRRCGSARAGSRALQVC